jgi:replication-associated recombination protein RarA
MSIEIVGHESVLRRLRLNLPSVSLFLGATSVGKWTTAQWVREQYKVSDGDFLAVRSLTVESATKVSTFLRFKARDGNRLAVVYVGSAGWTAQNVLLSSLENIGPSSAVILVADRDESDIAPTLYSRAEVFAFGRLHESQVAEILIRRGFKESTANHLATLSDGRVQPALRLLNQNETKVAVLGVVRALLLRDAKTLDTFASRWSEEHTALLDVLCREAITGRPMVFEAESIEALGRKLALKILTALRHDVRARLVVHSQLMGVLRGD